MTLPVVPLVYKIYNGSFESIGIQTCGLTEEISFE
jgi:hypothetical protein